MAKTHEQRICANPACQLAFTPEHGSQSYHSAECQVNYNNDKKKQENDERFFREKDLRRNDRLLEEIYNSKVYQRIKHVPETVLLYLEINLDIGTLHENLLTKEPIRWFHAYGLELVDPVNRLFDIHLRPLKKQSNV